MDDLQIEFQKQIDEYLESIKDKIIELMQEAIEESVYDISNPNITWYERTDNFKNAVDIVFEGDNLIVYINTDKLNYYSYISFQKTDNDVSSIVPWLLEEGHYSDKQNQYGLYKEYSGRHYLELAQEKIHNEFPELQLTIINEEPEWI